MSHDALNTQEELVVVLDGGRRLVHVDAASKSTIRSLRVPVSSTEPHQRGGVLGPSQEKVATTTLCSLEGDPVCHLALHGQLLAAAVESGDVHIFDLGLSRFGTDRSGSGVDPYVMTVPGVESRCHRHQPRDQPQQQRQARRRPRSPRATERTRSHDLLHPRVSFCQAEPFYLAVSGGTSVDVWDLRNHAAGPRYSFRDVVGRSIRYRSVFSAGPSIPGVTALQWLPQRRSVLLVGFSDGQVVGLDTHGTPEAFITAHVQAWDPASAASQGGDSDLPTFTHNRDCRAPLRHRCLFAPHVVSYFVGSRWYNHHRCE
jgi:hypothetical protein